MIAPQRTKHITLSHSVIKRSISVLRLIPEDGMERLRTSFDCAWVNLSGAVFVPIAVEGQQSLSEGIHCRMLTLVRPAIVVYR